MFQPERLSEVNESQNENMLSMLVTLAVFQPEILNDFMLEQ